MKKIFRLTSIENASVLRKFSVLFFLVSIVPFLVLAAVYFIFYSKAYGQLTLSVFFWTLLVVGVFSLIGFIGMRITLVRLIKVTQSAKAIIEGGLGKRIPFNARQDNEVTQLARSFNGMVEKLEENVRQLEKSKRMAQDILLRVASGVSSAENVESFLGLILAIILRRWKEFAAPCLPMRGKGKGF